jgi:hypothetical protein
MFRLSLFAVCLFTVPLLADDRPKATPEEIAKLIKQLDADEFDTREQATEALIKLGEPTEDALKKVAAETKSIEVKQRVERVLVSINRERLQRNALKLDTIYQLAREICDKKAKPEDLDPIIDKILEEIATAAKYEFKPPVRVANCTLRPGGPGAEMNSLIIGGEESPTIFLRNSAAVFDVGGQCSSIQNSIVVAWGVVDVSSCTNSIIIAGADVNVSAARNSIILSGGRIDVNSCQKTVLGCSETLRATFPRENSIVVNTKYEPMAGAAGVEPVTVVEVPGLVLRDKPLMERVLDNKLQLTYLTNAFMLFRLPDQPGEYVVRTGNELLDPLGKPLPGLEDWKVARLSTRFAMLKKGDERTYLRMARPGE